MYDIAVWPSRRIYESRYIDRRPERHCPIDSFYLTDDKNLIISLLNPPKGWIQGELESNRRISVLDYRRRDLCRSFQQIGHLDTYSIAKSSQIGFGHHWLRKYDYTLPVNISYGYKPHKPVRCRYGWFMDIRQRRMNCIIDA